MSSYENYTKTASTYDCTRDPIGIDLIVACLGRSPVPLAQQTLLDAGCGTGNYSLAMINYVGQIAAVDLNAGMLSQARSKLPRSSAARIKFHQTSITQLPFGSSTFDGIMINQVLHHIADDAACGYPRTREVIMEFSRVLKPGGTFTINICSQQQLLRGFWYCALIPEEASQMCTRHIPLTVLAELLEESGFENHGRIVPMDAVLQGQAYFNPRGPLDPSWRDGDSIWSTVSPDRLDEVCARLRQLDGDGTLDDFMRQEDSDRENIGQVTFIHARRNGS